MHKLWAYFAWSGRSKMGEGGMDGMGELIAPDGCVCVTDRRRQATGETRDATQRFRGEEVSGSAMPHSTLKHLRSRQKWRTMCSETPIPGQYEPAIKCPRNYPLCTAHAGLTNRLFLLSTSRSHASTLENADRETRTHAQTHTRFTRTTESFAASTAMTKRTSACREHNKTEVVVQNGVRNGKLYRCVVIVVVVERCQLL